MHINKEPVITAFVISGILWSALEASKSPEEIDRSHPTGITIGSRNPRSMYDRETQNMEGGYGRVAGFLPFFYFALKCMGFGEFSSPCIFLPQPMSG